MSEYRKTMGERMKAQRKQMYLTQEQMAERLDISIDYPIPVRIIEIYQKCPDDKKDMLLELLELAAKLYL